MFTNKENRMLTIKYLLFSISFVFLLTGCGSINIDKDQTDLMPKSVAKSIFEKYGYKAWAGKPFVSNTSFCGNEKEYIEFSQLKKAIYTPQGKVLHFYMDKDKIRFCPKLVYFPKVTESQALELTNAVRALGATEIEKLDWVY